MSKKPTLLLSLSLVLVVLLPGVAFPHGGGLDSYGCHQNHKEGGYHCHRGSFAGQSFATKAEMLQRVRQPDPQPSERPEQTPQQQVIPTPEPTPIATPSFLSMQAGKEYGKCLLVIDGETVELAPVEPVQRSGVGLRETGYQTAQASPCASIFNMYSNSEIVDVVVYIRPTWMTIAGVKAIPEMLGKAADPYVSAATTCRDMALAHVSPRELTNTLRMQRNKRARQVRCLASYRQQMQTPVAEGPL
jgi:hypothetical protein